jgi:hypothetical protein
VRAGSVRARIAVTVYAVSLVALFGREINDDDLARLCPLQHEHIKMLGTFHFALPDELTAGQRRTLRTSDDRRA